jgi:hypothetical protein
MTVSFLAKDHSDKHFVKDKELDLKFSSFDSSQCCLDIPR